MASADFLGEISIADLGQLTHETEEKKPLECYGIWGRTGVASHGGNSGTQNIFRTPI